jgi:hypothetical protein
MLTHCVHFSGPFYSEVLVTQRARFFCSWVLSFYGVTPCICWGYCYAISMLLPLSHKLLYCVSVLYFIFVLVVFSVIIIWCVSSDEAFYVWKHFFTYHRNLFLSMDVFDHSTFSYSLVIIDLLFSNILFVWMIQQCSDSKLSLDWSVRKLFAYVCPMLASEPWLSHAILADLIMLLV